MLRAPLRLIKTITFHPYLNPKSPDNGLRGAVVSRGVEALIKGGEKAPMVEIETRRLVPIPRQGFTRSILVTPEDLTMNHRLSAPISPTSPRPSAAERAEMKREAEKALEYERNHLLSAPFRHASRAFFGMFKNIGRVWTREGFLKLDVQGIPRGQGTYKLDVTGGWALDEGRALDRLVKAKAKAM